MNGVVPETRTGAIWDFTQGRSYQGCRRDLGCAYQVERRESVEDFMQIRVNQLELGKN